MTYFNKSSFIDAAESFAQKAVNLGCEIVLVDDGSTDGSILELRRIAQEIEGVVLVEQTNQGSASARNTAISRATRDYLVFLDFDDSINLEILIKSLNQLKESNASFGYLNYSTNPEMRISKMDISLDEPKILQMMDCRDDIYDSMGYWRYIYSRDFINEMNLRFMPTFSEAGGFFILDDMFWLLHNSSLDLEVLVFPEKWVIYNYFTNSKPSTNSWLNFQKQVLLLPQAVDVFIKSLEFCNHTHDKSWLAPKVHTMMQQHLRLLNFMQISAVLPSYSRVIRRNKDFFEEVRIGPKSLEALRLLLFGGKNSIHKLLSKSQIGSLLLRGYRLAK
jgi:glycosyltransferase involved in cell wall biosynthesis